MPHKIGWCDDTINPGWGCKNKCKYCYARRIAKRMGYHLGKLRGYTEDQCLKMKNYELIWFPEWMEIFNEKVKCKKPKRFFIGDMSEIADWKLNRIAYLLSEIQANNRFRIHYKFELHTFQFLTKNPTIYDRYDFPENCWLGWTITKDSDVSKFLRNNKIHINVVNNQKIFYNNNKNNLVFVSLEPLHGEVCQKIISIFDWIILGLETGNRKGKIIPKFKWIDDIYQTCGKHNIPIYMKDNLLQAFPDLVLRKQFPGD